MTEQTEITKQTEPRKYFEKKVFHSFPSVSLFPFVPYFLFCWLLLIISSSNIFAQGGSGDLPPISKPPVSRTKPRPTSKPKPTPPVVPVAPKPAPKPFLSREPYKIDTIQFDQEVEGSVDPETSGRLPLYIYYQEFNFFSTEDDFLSLTLSSSNPNLKLELFDEAAQQIPLRYDDANKTFHLATNDKLLPEDGKYRVRLSFAAGAPLTETIKFFLKINHLGLTVTAYEGRLRKVIETFNLPGEHNVDDAILRLQKIVRDDPNQAGGYEYLGILYNEQKQDYLKAERAMAQAIKLGGSATFKITHDSQWRKPSFDKKTKKNIWTAQRTDWIRIYRDKIYFVEFGPAQIPIFALTTSWLTDIRHPTDSEIVSFKHNDRKYKPDSLFFGFKDSNEAQLAFQLISSNFPERTNELR